jgi:SAM-dependent methyltransferase
MGILESFYSLDKYIRFVSEVSQVLRPGGIFVIADFRAIGELK